MFILILYLSVVITFRKVFINLNPFIFMKQHIKKLSVLLLLIIATIFSSCEAEKEFIESNNNHNNQETLFKQVNLTDIPGLGNKLNPLKSEMPISGMSSRTTGNINYFDIIIPYNINSFLYDKTNDLHYYTFALNLEETNTKTNLVAKETLTGEFRYYIFKFKPENYQEWYNAIKNSDINYNKSITFEAFEIQQSQYTASSTMCMETTEVWTCPYGEHTLGERNWYDCVEFTNGNGMNRWIKSYTYQMVACGGIGGGGGSNPSNPSNPGNPNNPGNPGGGNGAGAIPNLTIPDPCVMSSSTSFVDTLNDTQKAWWNNPQNSQERNLIQTFLGQNGCNTENQQFADVLIEAAIDYLVLYGNNPTSHLFLAEFFNDIFTYEEIDVEDVEVTPPSCESFNFTSTGTNWQMAAVANIRFQITVLTPQGAYVSHVIDFPHPMLFEAPKNLSIGNTIVTPGMAASASATALMTSIKETVKIYGNKPVSELVVRLYFEQRLKHNYPFYMPGGRVKIHPTILPVTPTQYQTNAFGIGNCN